MQAHLQPLLRLIPGLPSRPVSPVPESSSLSVTDEIEHSHSFRPRQCDRSPVKLRIRSASEGKSGLPEWSCEVPLERTPLDTLFFAFYHQAGSWTQLRAAQELQRQGWLYHRKYQTWFRATKSGSYHYFDHEGTWALRTKPGFVFDPAMQEDTD